MTTILDTAPFSRQADARRILIIGDYGKGTPEQAGHNDLAFFEVVQKFKELYPDSQIDFVSVPPFDSRRTAEAAYEAANSGRYDLVFHNTAPRKDAQQARKENAGEMLAYTQKEVDGKLVTVVGVASGNKDHNAFSYFRGEGCSIYAIDVEQAAGKVNTQFRSRDTFPPATKAVTEALENGDGHPSFCEDITHYIPVLAERQGMDVLSHVNGYGKVHPHGEVEGYATLITPGSDVAFNMNEMRGIYPNAEMDVLALRGEDSWIEAGFALQQLALSDAAEHIHKRSFGVYLQPTGDMHKVTLHNNVEAVVDDERVLYQLAPHIKEVLSFRGANIEPWDEKALGAFRRKAADAMAEQKFSVAYADGYGNLKLVMTHDQLLAELNEKLQQKGVLKHGSKEIPGDKGIAADVSFRGADGKTHTLQAKVTGESFGVADGETALSQGSSGHGPFRHAEVFLRGGNAQKALGGIAPGQRIEISNVRLVDKDVQLRPGTTITPDGDAQRLGRERPNRATGL